MIEGLKPYPVKVRLYDTDLSGTVFFANEIKWLDSAAGMDFMQEDLGISYVKMMEAEIDIAVANVNFNYKTPLFLDDVVDYYVWISKIGNKSFTLACESYKRSTGELVVQGEITYVCVHIKTRKSTPIPEDIKKLMEKGLRKIR